MLVEECRCVWMCSSLMSPVLHGIVSQIKAATQCQPLFFFLCSRYLLSPFRIAWYGEFYSQTIRPHLPVFITYNQFPFSCWSWPWIFFLWWINETIFGLLSSSSLHFLCLCLSPQSSYVLSSPHFCFYVTSIISFHLHLGLPLPCFLCGILKCVM
jgi:hypothetical protein